MLFFYALFSTLSIFIRICHLQLLTNQTLKIENILIVTELSYIFNVYLCSKYIYPPPPKKRFMQQNTWFVNELYNQDLSYDVPIHDALQASSQSLWFRKHEIDRRRVVGSDSCAVSISRRSANDLVTATWQALKTLYVRAVYSARSSASKSRLKAVSPLMPITTTLTDEKFNSHVKLPTFVL